MAGITKLDHELETLQFGDLQDMKMGDKIEIHNINQGLPKKNYDLSDWEFLKWCEKKTRHRYEVDAPADNRGRRYVSIERIK